MKFKITIILLFVSLVLNAQKKYPWRGNNDFLLEYLQKYDFSDSLTVYYRIPVTFFVYGKPPASLRDVKNELYNLNYFFTINKTGIRFYLADYIRIEKRSKKRINYITEAPIISTFHKRKGTVNIHYVNVLQKNFIFKKKYFAGVHNMGNHTVVLSRGHASSTIAHEVGHFFGLRHPHRDWKKGKRKQECVSRTRTLKNSTVRICEVNGDWLCDTPAEPNLYYYTDDSCHYIGNITDKWGDKYHPNTNNIMSYTKNRYCRYKFTDMQRAVMLYRAENEPFSQYWKVNDQNLHYSFDKFEPDNQKIIATALELNKPQIHTFHKSFVSAKNVAADNDVDWFKFKSDGDIYVIEFQQNNFEFPQIKLQVLKAKDTINTFTVSEPQKIEINLKKGVYFFRVSKTQPLPDGHLFEYKIKIYRKND